MPQFAPLTPLTDDPTDLLPLTPGHFFIGEPFASLQTSTASDVEASGLTRRKLINNMNDHFTCIYCSNGTNGKLAKRIYERGLNAAPTPVLATHKIAAGARH